MEAKELRLGNLFIEENSSEVIEVIELAKTKIWFTGNFPKGWQAKPIPLTEEWLIKFGFENDEDDSYSTNYKGVFFSSLSPFNEVVSSSYHEVTIEHVHQLQNLYFALTNKELNIK